MLLMLRLIQLYKLYKLTSFAFKIAVLLKAAT